MSAYKVNSGEENSSCRYCWDLNSQFFNFQSWVQHSFQQAISLEISLKSPLWKDFKYMKEILVSPVLWTPFLCGFHTSSLGLSQITLIYILMTAFDCCAGECRSGGGSCWWGWWTASTAADFGAGRDGDRHRGIAGAGRRSTDSVHCPRQRDSYCFILPYR